MVLRILFFSAWLSLTSVASGDTEPVDGWKLVSQSKGHFLYERDVPGSDLIAFRGEGVLDAPIAKAAAVILDHARATEWVDSLEESRILKRIGPMEYIEYYHIGTPFVMKDRDFVVHVRMEVDRQNKQLVFRYRSGDSPDAPKTKHIRGELMSSRFILTSLENGAKTSLLAEIHADPKGSVPKWIVNLFQRKWPSLTFAGIKKQLEKPRDVPKDFENVISQLQF